MCENNIKENKVIREIDVNIMILNKLAEISEKLDDLNRNIFLISSEVRKK